MPDLTGLKVHELAVKLGDDTCAIVETWRYFHRDTLGKQIVRSADSVRANIAEGYVRYSFPDRIRFCHIARGSLMESKRWTPKTGQGLKV